jgi:hypothetical protein
MKITYLISTAASMLVLAFSCFSNAYAQKSRDESTDATEHILQEHPLAEEIQNENLQKDDKMETQAKQKASETSRKGIGPGPKVTFVKMADFYLRNGKLVFGKLLSEDKNKIILERLDESKIVVSTYSKKEVDGRTLRIRNISEVEYYLNLAEYFSGRTWDFRDDPDDFIQAIRCYEKARLSAQENHIQNTEEIEQINQSLQQLQADRQFWISEAKSRAELKKLEFEAVIETRIKDLEDKVNANSRKLDNSIEQLDKIIADMKDNYQKLEKSISQINKGLSHQLETLSSRIESNRRMIDDIGRRRYLYPPRYYPYR